MKMIGAQNNDNFPNHLAFSNIHISAFDKMKAIVVCIWLEFNNKSNAVGYQEQLYYYHSWVFSNPFS